MDGAGWKVWGRVLTMGACLAACGPEAPGIPDAALRSVCGQPEGPIQLLALGPDETVRTHPKRAGDRWVFAVHDIVEDGALSTPTGNVADWSGARIMSVDACGEDLQTILPGAAHFDRHEVNGTEVWLGCVYETSELFVLDPTSQQPPRSLGRVAVAAGAADLHPLPTPCAPRMFADGAVILQRPGDEDQGPIVRIALSEDGPEAEVVLGHGHWLGGPRTATDLSEVFVEAPDGSVVALDVQGGPSEIVLQLEPDQYVRWYADGILGVHDRETLALRLYDRRTGAHLDVPPVPGDRAVVQLSDYVSPDRALLRRASGEDVLLVWLPELTTQTLEGAWQGGTRVGATAAVVSRMAGDVHDLYVIDAPGSEPRRLLAGSGGPSWFRTQDIIAPDRPQPRPK
ncbi:MAG: hypothetical protein AAF721_33325, partial [Myxococcota bacterium]